MFGSSKLLFLFYTKTMFKKTLILSIGVLVVLAFGVANLAQAGDKILVCHNTSSSRNPVVLIEVSSQALNGHLLHGDFPPEEETMSCDGGGPVPE